MEKIQKIDKKINIAFVIGHLSHGGAEKQLYLLCKGINRKKYNLVVFCLSNKNIPWGNRISSLGVPVIYFTRLSGYDISRVIKLACCFYIYKINVIVSYLHIGNVYAYLARCLYLRESFHISQIRSRECSMKGFIKWMNILSLKKSNCIVTNSTQLVDFVKTFFRQKIDKVNVIHNGIEYFERSNKSDDGNISLGIIGKDTKDKNIPLFVDTAINLLKKYQNVSFHLCGRELGTNNKFLQIIPKAIRSKFMFYGEVEDPYKFLCKLNIYLSTSDSEGLPNAIMEAMSAGLPVIATAVGGTSELIQQNQTGYLVPKGDLKAIVHYCTILIEDEKLRIKLGLKGRKFISDNFSIQKMVREYEEVLSEIDFG